MYTQQNIFADDHNYRKLLNMADAFSRQDESDDAVFYQRPRMVQHLDSGALKIVSSLIEQLIVEDNPVILDLMASIDSHIPENLKMEKVIGLGLNGEELNANSLLTERIIRDINKIPKLPFPDNSIDIVLNTASVQYLTNPQKIFSEVARVLKPGGMHLIIFSNRTFPTKAVKVWELLTDDERTKLICDYFAHSGRYYEPETFISMGRPRPQDDKYAKLGLPGDPIFAVYADRIGMKRTRPKPIISKYKNAYDDIPSRVKAVKDTHDCPYCGEKMRLWAITDNPMSTWDHDLYICVNDACPYTVKGWKVMYDQGNFGVSYRLCYDPKSDTLKPIPIPSLSVIKDSLRD